VVDEHCIIVIFKRTAKRACVVFHFIDDQEKSSSSISRHLLRGLEWMYIHICGVKEYEDSEHLLMMNAVLVTRGTIGAIAVIHIVYHSSK